MIFVTVPIPIAFIAIVLSSNMADVTSDAGHQLSAVFLAKSDSRVIKKDEQDTL